MSQLSGSVTLNGDGGRSFVHRLGLKVGSRLTLFCIHRVNRVNSCNDSESWRQHHKQFRVATTVYQCLHGMAPSYLAELCLPITASASRRGGLRSATTSNLVVPRCRLTTYGTRAFSVAGPVCWNALPDYLKSSDLSFNCLGNIKTFLFCKYWRQSPVLALL